MPVRAALGFILNIKPGGWALAYGAAFVAYGLAYLALAHAEPHSFYQAAVALEPRYRAEQAAVSRTLLADVQEMFRNGVDRQKQAGYEVRAASVSFDNFEIDSKSLAHIAVDIPVCDFKMGCGSPGAPAWSYRIALRATGRSTPVSRVVFEIDDVSAKNDRIWFHYPSTRPAMDDDAIAARIRQVVENRPVFSPCPRIPSISSRPAHPGNSPG